MRFLYLSLFLLTSLFANERAIYENDFETDTTGLFLPVNINGKECKFLFDTGASFVVLDKSFKHLLGKPLSLREAQARTGMSFKENKIVTPSGEIDLEIYGSIPMKLGKLQVANRYPYITADLKALWPFSGEKFCGILGTSFLHQFRWEIDFEKGHIKAYTGFEPYLGEYSIKTPVFWSASRIPQVNASVADQSIAFDIDIGDNGSGRLLKENVDFLKKIEFITKSHEQDIVTVSEIYSSEEFRLKKISFANVDYDNIVMQTSKQNALGLAFFKRHNLVFDFPFNMLYLKHHSDYNSYEEIDKSGIRVVLQEGKLIVFSIKKMNGATLTDIKVSDEIISVNNRELSLFELRKALRQKEGTRLSLKIKRDNKILPASIILGKDPL